MPGYWEFPGGKCEQGESPAHCAARECREEVGVPVVVGACRRVVRHPYPHGLVELHFFDCQLAEQGNEPAPETGFRWVAARDLSALAFPGGNDSVIAELVRESLAKRVGSASRP